MLFVGVDLRLAADACRFGRFELMEEPPSGGGRFGVADFEARGFSFVLAMLITGPTMFVLSVWQA